MHPISTAKAPSQPTNYLTPRKSVAYVLWRDFADRRGHDLKNHVSPVQVRPSAQRAFAVISGVRRFERWSLAARRFIRFLAEGHAGHVTMIVNHLLIQSAATFLGG